MPWVPQSVLNKLANGEPQILLFTSCQAGAGTTYTLIESALDFYAQYPMYRILLVDFNATGKSLSQYSTASKGWQAVLETNTFTPDTLSFLNDHSEIAVLPSAPDAPPTNSLKLSNALKMLKNYTKYYDLILVDSPSVLPTKLSYFFGEKSVDGIILVVESGKTRKPVIKESIASIKNFGGELLGIILNRRKHLIPECLYHRFF